MEVFQGSSTEIKPQTDRNRRQITSSQYGSAPSLNEESIKTTQNRLLGPREDISKLSDYTKSMRGLSTVAPREQNILRVSQPGIVIKQEIAKNAPAAKNSEFELYLSGSCDKGSVQVNETPIEIIPPVNQSQNVSSVGMSGPSNGQKFTPNIYNKIEISYITNNFSHGNSHLFPSGGSGKYSAPGRGPKNPDQSVSLNDSYAMDSSNYKELLTQGYGNGLQGSGSDKIGSPLTKPIPLAHSLNQKSENGVTLIKFQATDAQEDQNILMRTSLVKDSSFKQENQYRSLHELSISRPAEADPKLLAMTSLRPDPNRLYMPRDTTRSQILPRGSNTDSGHSQPKNPVSNIGSPQFTKRTVGSRTIICSGKLGSDKESTGKITAAKLAGLASTKKDKKPVINSDAQLKISKKISNIFQQIGINIKGNRNSNVSCKKTVNSNSNNSIDVKQSRRDSASSSVHDLLKQLKRKKSDKGSLAGVHKKSTSGLSSAKKKTISQINSKSKVSSFLNPKRSETKEVSLYQESDTSKKEELTSRNGHAYNLLYDKAKMQKKPKNASIALNSNDKIFGSVFDAGKKLYIGQSPLNLSALSRKSPADLINQVSESLKKSYRAADISVTNDQSYGLTVKIMRISFVIRIEALDGLKDLHTIAVYPKIVSCRATLAKYLNALFDQLEL